MAFGQFNTGFQVGMGNKPFSSGLNTGFSSPLPTTNTPKKEDNTYNPRYPGFDEEDYKKLEQMVASKGLTGSKKTEVMDQLYQQLYPKVLNKHKLDEREVEINNSVHQNGELLLNGNTEAKAGTGMTKIAQEAKKKYNIPYNVDDQQLVDDIVSETPEGNKLLYEYVNNGNPEIFYAAGIWDRPNQQGGTTDLINQASTNGKSWEDKSKREKGETVTNYTNVIGYGTEKLDEKAGEFADNWLNWGTKAAEGSTESLKEKLDNMSQEEVERYRQIYQQSLKDKDWRVARVKGDTVVGRLWNAIKGDLSYEYNDEDFMKWLISQKANLWESMSGADDILKGETNPNVIQFFGNIPSSALKTFTATVRGLTNPYDTLKGIYTLAATEEGHQAILQRYGSWEAFANALNTDPVGVADDMLAVAELVAGGVKGVGKLTGNEGLVNMVDNLNIGSANDALAQQTVGGIYGGLDKLAGMTNSNAVNKLNNFVQTESNLGKMVETGKDVYDRVKDSKVVKGVDNFIDEVVDKTVGIDKEDRQFIRENKDLVNEYLDGKKNVETVFDDVKEKVSEKRLANTEMGKEYGELRKDKSKVVNTEGITSDMKKTLKKNGITIDKNGNLKFSDMSKFNAKQKAALIDAWNELKLVESKKNINAGNVLDMRQKFDDKLKWDGKASDLKDITQVDRATEGLIKDMRGVIDNRAKNSVAGLKELDAKYSESLAEIRQIRKDWLNDDGTFKDNARSKLRNLTKAGNEEKLARLEKVIPGITNDLKALDAALTVDRVTKMGVGQYVKGAGLGGSAITALFTGHPLAALGIGAVGVLATPKNFVWLISNYPELGNKLISGAELTTADINQLSSIASRLQDGMDVQLEE